MEVAKGMLYCLTCTYKKRKENFPQIQMGSVGKVIYKEGLPMRKCANICSYMKRSLVIYDFATDP
jgi:hypothetical protein